MSVFVKCETTCGPLQVRSMCLQSGTVHVALLLKCLPFQSANGALCSVVRSVFFHFAEAAAARVIFHSFARTRGIACWCALFLCFLPCLLCKLCEEITCESTAFRSISRKLHHLNISSLVFKNQRGLGNSAQCASCYAPSATLLG